MKLMLIVVQESDAHILAQNLNHNNIMCTKISSMGGFLRRGNTTFLIGIEEELVDSVIGIAKASCGRRKTILYTSPAMDSMSGLNMSQGIEIETGGANIFVVNLEQLGKI